MMANRFDNTGGEFEDNFDANMEYLEQHLDEVSAKNRSFVQSLCQAYSTRGSLSEKQKYWAAKYWEEVRTSLGKATGSVKTVPTLQIDGSSMITLFDKAAASGIRFPAINITLSAEDAAACDCSKIRFYRTSDRSRAGEGCVAIVDKTQRMEGDSKYLGIITRKGLLTFTEHCWDKLPLQKLIKRLAEAPVTEAAITGRRVGHCCFCGKELTNKFSLHHGYGPICADKWGLPHEWNDGTEEEEVTSLDIGLPLEE